MKKLLSVIVAASFLAGLGCGDSTTVKKEKETKTTRESNGSTAIPLTNRAGINVVLMGRHDAPPSKVTRIEPPALPV